jgi:GNAT superfamily N-acetyltransferase
MKTSDHAKQLEIYPLTPERWPDLETLFGPNGASAGCWCMYWRQSRAEFKARRGENNHQALQALAMSGKPLGLLAYAEGKPVGWMAIAPRQDYPAMDASRVIKQLDEKKVWAISCFYTSPKFRRAGVTAALIEAAKDYVRQHRGTIIEGYPIVPLSDKVSPGSAYTGLHSAFLRAGFKEVARYSATRPIMRFEL